MTATEMRSAGAAGGKTGLLGSLFTQVLIALLLGIVIGVVAPETAQGLKFFSDACLKLISPAPATCARSAVSASRRWSISRA